MKLTTCMVKFLVFIYPALSLANGSSTGGVVMNQTQGSSYEGSITEFDFSQNTALSEKIKEGYLTFKESTYDGMAIEHLGDGTAEIYINPENSDYVKALTGFQIQAKNLVNTDLDQGTLKFRVDSGLTKQMSPKDLKDSLVKHGVGVNVIMNTYGVDPSASLSNESISDYKNFGINDYLLEPITDYNF